MRIGFVQGLAFFAALCAILYVIEHLRGTFRPTKVLPDSPETSKLRARIGHMARDALLLVSAQSSDFSKIGGYPELPAGAAWPSGKDGPLAFVCQLDLEVLRAEGQFDWLPDSGRIYLFFDDALNGEAGCGKIIFSHERPGAEQLPPRAVAKDRRFAERRVAFKRIKSFPSEDWLGEAWPAEFSETALETLKAADIGDQPDHRVGGYPDEIQNSQMALECEHLHRGLNYDYRTPPPDDIRQASRQWRLLMQIDSDSDLKMNWWDGGRLYVFARARDLKRGDFSKTVTITQTY